MALVCVTRLSGFVLSILCRYILFHSCYHTACVALVCVTRLNGFMLSMPCRYILIRELLSHNLCGLGLRDPPERLGAFYALQVHLNSIAAIIRPVWPVLAEDGSIRHNQRKSISQCWCVTPGCVSASADESLLAVYQQLAHDGIKNMIIARKLKSKLALGNSL